VESPSGRFRGIFVFGRRGGAHINAEETDPHTHFRQIAEELRTSYEVGYYPTNKAKDDSFRRIVIRTRVEGVKVRAKTRYFAR
jgi:hypothetical protein